MKTRRHHNTDGRRRTQRGKRKSEVAHMARRLGIPPAACELFTPPRELRHKVLRVAADMRDNGTALHIAAAKEGMMPDELQSLAARLRITLVRPDPPVTRTT